MDQSATQTARLRDDFLLTALYFAQALPMGFAWLGLPPWLRAQQVSLEVIGAIALSALPWALKFIWAAKVERLSIRYGCRKVIIVTQLAAVLAILCLIDLDFVAQLPLGIALLIVINALGATQDIATDRYAILRRGASGAARVNITRFIGFTAGMLAGGSGLLLLSMYWSWDIFILSWAGLMAVITGTMIFLDEPSSVNTKAEPGISLRYFLRRPMALRLLGIALIFKTALALSDGMLKSFWVDYGVTLEQISLLITLNIGLSGFIGAPLGAWLIMRHNKQKVEASGVNTARTIAVMFGVISAFILILLGFAIFNGIGITQMAGWDWLYIVLPALLALCDGAAGLAFFTLFMRWSVGTQPGTTFTLFICAESFGGILLATLAGFAAANLGYALHFMLTALLTLLAMTYAWRTITLYSQTTTEQPIQQEAEHVVA